MNAKDFEGKTVQEIQDILTKELEEKKESVNKMSDEAELKKLEEDIDKEQEEFDNYLKEVKYELTQEPIDFEGKQYTPKSIAGKIVYFLNRIEQDFQYALGLHSLVLLWKQPSLTEISYGAYDSTLRLLGQQKYKGNTEWTDILAINNYLVCAHEQYYRDRSILLFLAEYRNAVVSRLQLIQKNPTENAEK